MARTARASKGGICYHVVNRGNNRATIFHAPADYHSFIDLMARACDRLPMRIFAYCLMPNHFHLLLQPYADRDLSRWMQWLLTSHVRRYHRLRKSSGRVWQGRFKAFPVQEDTHLLRVMRYVERNPLRASLVNNAADWPWSSLTRAATKKQLRLLAESPVAKPVNWPQIVAMAQSQAELDALRQCGRRDAPFGDRFWVEKTAEKLGLQTSIRELGRPETG